MDIIEENRLNNSNKESKQNLYARLQLRTLCMFGALLPGNKIIK